MKGASKVSKGEAEGGGGLRRLRRRGRRLRRVRLKGRDDTGFLASGLDKRAHLSLLFCFLV